MERNWFCELGLEKVADMVMPRRPSAEFLASLFGGGMGGRPPIIDIGGPLAGSPMGGVGGGMGVTGGMPMLPGPSAVGGMTRYDPRVARYHESMNRLRDFFARGAGGPRTAQPVNVVDITPKAPSVAQAVSKSAPAASKLSRLAKLFPKGSGSSAAVGALIPLGLLLASRLFAGQGSVPDWAQMHRGGYPYGDLS